MKILFVCTGNICRSPTAEGVMRAKMPTGQFDSAGTHAYHVGEAPDPRSISHAAKRGYDLSNLRARKITQADFTDFEVILCMDNTHYDFVTAMRPKNTSAKVHLYLEYAGQGKKEVPDPYYGNYRDFDHVLDLVEDASERILSMKYE